MPTRTWTPGYENIWDKKGGMFMGSKNPERTRIWRYYFTMIFRAGLSWALMIVCFLLSLAAAQLALTFANRMADSLTS